MRVLHVLHTSLPHVCGYSIRTDYILQNEREQGMEVAGVTSAQHPTETGDLSETLGGIDFFRTPAVRGVKPPMLREWRLMRALQRCVSNAIRAFNPDLVHAHSPVIVGLPALRAARSASLPFVYEVRDLWENASVDRGKFGENSLFYKIARSLETNVLNRADAVVTICDKLRDELRPRLKSDDRLFVVENGVDASTFAPRADGQEQKRRRNLVGKKVLGYIGAFQPYEGLDVLIASMRTISIHEPNAHLVITGSGGVEDRLRAQVRETGLDNYVTFTGRVPHQEVGDLYAMIDLAVYPRILTRTTALTTPLKPLEAMSMAKPVLVSDVGAMQELVRPDVTGAVFRAGDADHLAHHALTLLQAPEDQLLRMGERARDWILSDRQWPKLISKYSHVYETASRDNSAFRARVR